MFKARSFFLERRFAKCGWLPGIGLVLWIGACISCQTGSSAINSEDLAPGVVHHEVYLLQGPWSIHIIEIDLVRAWKAGIRLRTAKSDPALEGEKTSNMATRAIAAINGDFFYSSGRPLGMQIHEGTLLQGPNARSAFAITADGSPMIAVFRFRVGLSTAAGQVLAIARFNRESVARGPIFYNYVAQTWKDSVHAAVGFQLQSMGERLAINDTIAARVLQVRRRSWPLRLDLDQWLVAVGSEDLPTRSIAPGDTIKLSFGLPPATRDLQEAIGGGPRIIRDGSTSVEYEREHLDYSFAMDRNSRTAIGYAHNRQTLFLVTVDGGQPGYSVGMRLEELADFMAHELADFTVSGANAYQALNMDGGGSTTMVVRRRVVNHPSDPIGERSVGNALLVVEQSTAPLSSGSSL